MSAENKEQHVSVREATIVVRPITPDDKAALQEGLEKMSTESRYRRFFSPVARLTGTQLRYFTEVDHHDHEALVAATEEGEPLGVARYVRLADDPQAAEAAVAVVDHWHNRGVGTALLRRLARRAREEGIDRFTATALAENQEVIELLGDLGPAEIAPRGDGTVELRVELPVTDRRGTRLWRALRRAAEGRLSMRGAVGSRSESEESST